MTVLVVWCLVSIPVGVVLGLCIREGKGAGPRLAAGPRAEHLAHTPDAVEDVGTEVPALPAQRRSVTLQGQLHDA